MLIHKKASELANFITVFVEKPYKCNSTEEYHRWLFSNKKLLTLIYFLMCNYNLLYTWKVKVNYKYMKCKST